MVGFNQMTLKNNRNHLLPNEIIRDGDTPSLIIILYDYESHRYGV